MELLAQTITCLTMLPFLKPLIKKLLTMIFKKLFTFLINKLKMVAIIAINKVKGLVVAQMDGLTGKFIRSLNFEELIGEEMEKEKNASRGGQTGMITDYKSLEIIFYDASRDISSIYNRVDVIELFELTYAESVILDEHTPFSRSTVKRLSSSTSIYRRVLEQINKPRRSSADSRLRSRYRRKGMGFVFI